MNLVPSSKTSPFLRARAGTGGNNGTFSRGKSRSPTSPRYRKDNLNEFKNISHTSTLKEKHPWDHRTQFSTGDIKYSSSRHGIIKRREHFEGGGPTNMHNDSFIGVEYARKGEEKGSSLKYLEDLASENYNVVSHNDYAVKGPTISKQDPRDKEILELKETLARERRETQNALNNAYVREQKLLDELAAKSVPEQTKQSWSEVEIQSMLRQVKEDEERRRIEVERNMSFLVEENKALRESLVLAKSYKLHKAMENMLLDSKKNDDKLKRIIVNLQADKNALLDKLSSIQS